MIRDCHVHVGRFKDGYYFDPSKVHSILRNLGIGAWVVSSTSTSDDDFEIVRDEINNLVRCAPDRTLPLLWVTPEMEKLSNDLSMYDGFPIYGIKVHGYANNWNLRHDGLKNVFRIADRKKLPVILHTGGSPESDAGVYAKLCQEFRKVMVVLAHGRPIHQAIQVMINNPNVYIDTAFMALHDIRSVVESVGNNRILFGTDFPLDSYFYPNQSLAARYKKRVITLVDAFGTDSYLSWNRENFEKVFNIKAEYV